MSAGTERARCRALLWLLARCASATASAAASAAVNGRWFILALLMELSPLPLLLERRRTLTPSAHGTGFWSTKLRYHVTTRGAFKDLRVEPSGKVTAANSYSKHNPTHYNQTNRRALTKLCLGQAAQNKLSSCGCKAVLQAPDFTSFFS